MITRRHERVKDIGLILFGALLLLVPALVNGFPFVYPDTGTYLRSAFQGYVPVDRPYWYGVFLRVASGGGHTFWGMVTAQALCCALYVFRTVRLFVGRERVHRAAAIVFVVLAAASSPGYYAGQLMPDIFTPIGILAVVLLLSAPALRWVQLFDLLVLLLACWVHLSHLLIVPLCGGLFLLLMRRTFRDAALRWLRLGVFTVLAWCGLGIADRVVDGRFYLSQGGHVFLLGRLLDTGILRPWLDEHCADGAYALCAYKDSLPANSTAFLWDIHGSPLYKQGGWAATRPAYERIVHDVLSEPKYFLRFAGAGVSSTVELLMKPGICTGLVSTAPRRPESPPYVMIAGTIPEGLDAYRSSLQNGGRGELDMTVPDALYALLLWGSAIAAVVMIVRAPRTASGMPVRPWMLFAIGAVVIACAVCATLSVVEDRYLGRVSWILPLFVLSAWLGRPVRGKAGTPPR